MLAAHGECEAARIKLELLRLDFLQKIDSDCNAPPTPTTAAPLTPVSTTVKPLPSSESVEEDCLLKELDYDALLQESTSPELLEGVKPHSQEVKDDPDVLCLLNQVRILSQECFLEDCLEHCSKRGGWRLTLLVARPKEMRLGPVQTVLLGFIVYRLKPELGVFSVAKIAVPSALRRHGFGRQLMMWGMLAAKRDQQIGCISLSALPQAVSFYQRLGFKKMHEITAKDDENALFPGQVYMELKMKKSRTASKPFGRR